MQKALWENRRGIYIMIVDFHLTDRECDVLDQGGFLKIRLPDGLVIVF